MKISRHRWQQDLGIPLLGFVLAVFLSLSPADAEQAAGTNLPTQTFAVALPELEGPVTMGIFSSKGDLVRLLYHDAPVESIPAGLNGLIMTWDEKDASGKLVPPGTYRARGLVHGPVSVSVLPFRDKSWLLPAVGTNAESAPKDSTKDSGASSGNRITIPAAKDELLSSQPMIVLTATPLEKGVGIAANGLPLLEIPLNRNRLTNTATLNQGMEAGSAIVTIGGDKECIYYGILGLDRLVPLEAGTLEIPPDAFHPAPVGEESRR
jgi:hypothetical protein